MIGLTDYTPKMSASRAEALQIPPDIGEGRGPQRTWTYPLENLLGLFSVRPHQTRMRRKPEIKTGTYHHDDLRLSIQCTINFSRSLGDRIGKSRAFSYSSIGITCSVSTGPSMRMGEWADGAVSVIGEGVGVDQGETYQGHPVREF